jgi:hypothetical protein
MRITVLAILMILTMSPIYAKPRYYYSQPNVVTQSYTSHKVSGSDQDRCQAEANHMAANNITSHVWGVIGNFEGVGYGSSPNCNTCTPSNNMSLTGDASAQGRNGMWYRVRSWR